MIRGFFRGRYGIDVLSIVFIVGALVLLKDKYLRIVGIIILGFVIFRGFSRNINQRSEEMRKFNDLMGSIGRFIAGIGIKLGKAIGQLNQRFGNLFTRVKQRKEYVFLKCPECRNNLRLPRNKGKLQVKCPVCKNEFIKKT